MKQTLLMMVMCLMALTVNAKSEKETVVLSVPLHCENCVKKVEGNIAFEKGVKAIKCDIKAQTVTVTYLVNKTNLENLKKGFAKIGFEDVKEVKAKCCGHDHDKEHKEEDDHDHDGHDHDKKESSCGSTCGSSCSK